MEIIATLLCIVLAAQAAPNRGGLSGEGDERQLLAGVTRIGPAAVAVDASQITFQSYSRGVYYDPNCSTATLNHAMLVVGYGTDARGGDYWLVKNSWGSSWGMHGYMKLARNRDKHCGIASAASYLVI